MLLLVLNAVGLLVFVSVLFLDLVFRYHYLPFWPAWNWYFGPAYCGSGALIAVVNFLMGKWWFAIPYALYVGFGAYLWWVDAGNRRRRRRIAARAARLARRAR